MYSEVESTARDILKKCREEGLRYRDIAVITGDLALYEKVTRVIFGEYGIPCFIDRKKDITGHPLVLLVLSALEIFTSNWSYEAVFRYLKTGLAVVEREDLDLLENYVLANGIKGSS
jgi:ATP-dependent helicase/nuclease subunit B